MILIGKWYLALRLKGDLCVGIGRASDELKAQAVRSRPNRGI